MAKDNALTANKAEQPARMENFLYEHKFFFFSMKRA